MQPTSRRSLPLLQLSLISRSLIYNLYAHTHVYTRRNHTSDSSYNSPGSSTQSASAKLFADAAKEEADAEARAEEASHKSTRLSILEQQHENWTGDESVKDAVLRMLVDKYKPLRTGTIQSAEQKLKQAPPTLAQNPHSQSNWPVPLKPASGSWANEPLLPSSEGHQPWHTRFKTPSHDVSSIKLAQVPPPIISSTVAKPSAGLRPMDDRARRSEKEKQKRAQVAGRLTEARESTLDYRMGFKGSARGLRIGGGQPNPVNVKGWTSLIEDKIERARQAGLFESIKGRGQPLVSSMEEYNPFIAREEFLMNRIVQRNGAVPPWVDVQSELETAVATFREILRQSYTRRTLRMLVLSYPPPLLQRLTLPDIKSHRDPQWVEREKAYHDAAIAELNALVRKYNGLAPYAVRRPYYMREAEMERLYRECGEDILRAIQERMEEGMGPLSQGGSGGGGGGAGSALEPTSAGDDLSLMDWLRRVLLRLFRVNKL